LALSDHTQVIFQLTFFPIVVYKKVFSQSILDAEPEFFYWGPNPLPAALIVHMDPLCGHVLWPAHMSKNNIGCIAFFLNSLFTAVPKVSGGDDFVTAAHCSHPSNNRM
jgi:hypothetical protein